MGSTAVVAVSETSSDLALLLLRSVFGVFFAIHGLGKIRNGIGGTVAWFGSIGMRRPGLQARLAAGTEIGAGVALALGLVTPLAAAGVVGVMAVATWVDHRGKGFFIYNNGWEYTVSIATVAVALALSGPGRVSLDEVLGLGFAGVAGGVFALGVGLAMAAGQLLTFYRPLRPTDPS